VVVHRWESDWTTKASVPRTLSPTSTRVSPSWNFSILARQSLVPRWSQIRCAKSEWLLPVMILKPTVPIIISRLGLPLFAGHLTTPGHN